MGGVAAVAALALVLGLLLTGVLPLAPGAFTATSRPCCSGPEACTVGSRPCPVTPPPPPATYLGAGTIFSIGAGGYSDLQFLPLPASLVELNGSFTSPTLVLVEVMTPSDFANFSSDPSAFQCLPSVSCFGAGPLTFGTFQASVPVTWVSSAVSPTVAPWYLVMVNTDAAQGSSVTWVTPLVGTFVDIYA